MNRRSAAKMMADQPLFWRRRGLVAWLLYPLSLLFRAVVSIRRVAYRRGWLTQYRPPVPVVIVGNITVGGNGKTPLVMALAQWFKDNGHHCSVVSRGYGGQVRRVAEVRTDSEAQHVGDEPLLIRQQADVPVFVAPRRAEAVKAALQTHPDTAVILCDDGLQHYALARDVEIIVIAGDVGLGNQWLLPAGPLRELPSRIAEADAVITNGAAPHHTTQHAQQFTVQGHCSQAYALHSGERIALSALAATSPLYLLTAIARPERVANMLHNAGITLAGTHFLPDHAPLHADEADFATQGCLLITTKDAVKTTHWPNALRAKTFVLDYAISLPQPLLTLLQRRLALPTEQYLPENT